MSNTDFSTLALQPELFTNLASLSYLEMTPIQAESLPPLLAGKDVIAQAKTGSGKTAAFGLWLLNKLSPNDYQVQVLVLCPTRELAEQVADELRRLARALANTKILTLCGGKPFGPQTTALSKGAQIVVGTPGRVEEHIRKGNLRLSAISCFALDEADRMLDMGFQSQLDAIMENLPNNKQSALFSATFSPPIESIAKRLLQSPVMVKLEQTHSADTISQGFYKVDDDQHRLLALRLLLLEHLSNSALIFCNTKVDVQTVLAQVQTWGFNALALHGDLDQKDRDKTLLRFAHKSANVLVATDVAARGIDIEAVDLVINFHVARESEVYVHRIGRTGRAGGSGLACSLYSDKEHYKLEQLAQNLDCDIAPQPLPSKEVLSKQPPPAEMVSLQINGGKKQKLRPGDILGALTAEGGIAGSQVGKIKIQAMWAYVAVETSVKKAALRQLNQGKLKGRSFKVRELV